MQSFAAHFQIQPDGSVKLSSHMYNAQTKVSADASVTYFKGSSGSLPYLEYLPKDSADRDAFTEEMVQASSLTLTYEQQTADPASSIDWTRLTRLRSIKLQIGQGES